MPFEKGNRANPGGRPRKTQEQVDFERKCREWAQLFALDKLKKASDSSKAMEIISAVKEICDRGFGKAEAISYIEANVTSETGSSIKEIEVELTELIGAPETKSIGSDSADKVDAGA